MNTAQQPMYKWQDLPWKKFERTVFKLQKRIYQASQRQANQGTNNHSQSSEEPCEANVCAVSRTKRIATGGGRSSGQMTPR